MTGKSHRYAVALEWTGNLGTGTDTYRTYGRNFTLEGRGKPPIPGSADPAFRGDAARYNPEDLVVAALSSCHLLWYLHLCATAGIVCVAYTDEAEGTLVVGADGGGEFSEVVLRPRATIRRGDDAATAARLHEEAHRLCFVARSVNFPVRCQPAIVYESVP
jgi:organic hydroperoxide reductase OsmC/OhrA